MQQAPGDLAALRAQLWSRVETAENRLGPETMSPLKRCDGCEQPEGTKIEVFSPPSDVAETVQTRLQTLLLFQEQIQQLPLNFLQHICSLWTLMSFFTCREGDTALKVTMRILAFRILGGGLLMNTVNVSKCGTFPPSELQGSNP